MGASNVHLFGSYLPLISGMLVAEQQGVLHQHSPQSLCVSSLVQNNLPRWQSTMGSSSAIRWLLLLTKVSLILARPIPDNDGGGCCCCYDYEDYPDEDDNGQIAVTTAAAVAAGGGEAAGARSPMMGALVRGVGRGVSMGLRTTDDIIKEYDAMLKGKTPPEKSWLRKMMEFILPPFMPEEFYERIDAGK